MPHIHATPARAQLRQLLAQRHQYPARAEIIDAEIRDAFERTVAILALDMCGFSRYSSSHGIIHFLTMIYQMEQAARPAIAGNGGKLIKQEADNLVVVFPTATQALEGALDILRAFDAMNAVLPNERDIYGCIGIGYGSALVIGHEDVFGDEVNFAFKLGEDIARSSEILLTTAAHAALGKSSHAFSAQQAAVGGIDLRYYQYQPPDSD